MSSDVSSQIQDPFVLMDPATLSEVLLEWLRVLERVLGVEEPASTGEGLRDEDEDRPREELWKSGSLEEQQQLESLCSSSGEPTEHVADEHPELPEKEQQGEGDSGTHESGEEAEKVVVEENTGEAENTCHGPTEPVRVEPPLPLPSDLLGDLTQLATLYLELSCFRRQVAEQGALEVGGFLRRYFFLLDTERVRHMCLLCHGDRPEVQRSFIEAMQELTRSSKVAEVIQKGDLLKSLRSLRELQPWSAPELLAHSHRLYDKHGEAAVRSFSQFYPTVTPADVRTMAQQAHFLAYLDNLVQSRAEEQRLSFLGSLLQPESLRQDWLELGLSHDAPQPSDTLTADGHPRWHSHNFSWGYGRLMSLLVRLPADLFSKQKMAETCRSHGYWTGYLYLCCELQRRTEAFSTVCRLDDMSLLDESQAVPQTVQEWKVLIQLSQQCGCDPAPTANGPPTANGTTHPSNETTGSVNGNAAPLVNGGAGERERQVTPENLTLRLAQTVGPDRALEILEECGLPLVLSPHSTLVCELLRVAEKRQR
ncbi:hypothetical protein NHX12_002942 [Muraenolepis orangiensis]|uniref:HPS5 TPR domain-containing protein n=1 Tax=Muraenolepis orangiensis TaxID=630683 RepID=A0A9Q0DZE1_9TELE|nr:hypothetical protein NHX12_002942 [Muraenolepis orangiensis]